MGGTVCFGGLLERRIVRVSMDPRLAMYHDRRDPLNLRPVQPKWKISPHSWEGHRGIIISPPKTVCAFEFSHMVLKGVSVHASRLFRSREPAKLTREVLKSTNGECQVSLFEGFSTPC